MTCEVVQDLLPLYVDGACTEGSKQLVEEHVKTCPGCKKLLEEMGAPLPELPVRELTESEQVLRHALKQMRRNSKRVVALCLAVLVLIPACVLFYRETSGMGVCVSSYGEYQRGRTIMQAWQEEGPAKAVLAMSPLYLFEEIDVLLSDYELVAQYGMASAGQESYGVCKMTSVELLGETYYIPGDGDFLRDADLLTTSAELERKALYEAGDELGVLHSLMLEDPDGIIVSQGVFALVQEKYGDLDAAHYYPLERGEETYLFYVDDYYIQEDGSFDRERCLSSLQVEYLPQLLALYPDLEPIDEEYGLFIRSRGSILPEALYGEFAETYAEICANYKAYTLYYADMGYEAYKAAYQSQLQALLEELEQQGCTILKARFLSIIRETRWDKDTDNWYVKWWLDLGECTALVEFTTHDNGAPGTVGYLSSITSYDASMEVQAIFDQINELGRGIIQ